MTLSRRLKTRGPDGSGPTKELDKSAAQDVRSIAARLHKHILDRLDLESIGQLSPGELAGRLEAIVEQVVAAERLTVDDDEQAAVVASVLDELTGLGPIEALLKDPTISDVLVNSPDQVFVERRGKLTPVDVKFRDAQHLVYTIQRIVGRVGRRIDESSPMVDARLPDGSRVNAIIPPLALRGPSLSIRRFSATPLTAGDLERSGAMSREMAVYLEWAVRARCSILIAGGTGAGKTTLLNVLSDFIPSDERIITIEDSAELRLRQPHVVGLEARPPNLEGKGEVTIRDLVRNSLRMRPDRIVVGEVRGAEVLDMLQAMNTGHDGSLATVHANTPDDAIARLITMLGMSGIKFAEDTMNTLIARAIHVVVHVARMQDGTRRITGISEIRGQVGTRIETWPVFQFQVAGIDGEGRVVGSHVHVGQTTLGDRFRAAGLAE